jgi:uncharacterized membrane protein YfcA
VITWDVLAACAVVYTGGLVSGLTGFGFGLVTAPPLLLLYPPPVAVVLTKVLTLTTSWVILLDARRDIAWRTVLALLPSALCGLAAGVAILRLAEASTIRLVASSVVLGAVLLSLRDRYGPARPAQRAHRWWATMLAGLTSGILSTSTGLSGPPVVFLLTMRGFGIHAFRGTLAAYFLVLDLIGLPAILTQHLVGRSMLPVLVVLVPTALLGRLTGIRVAHRVSVPVFRRVTLALLGLSSATGIISTLLH